MEGDSFIKEMSVGRVLGMERLNRRWVVYLWTGYTSNVAFNDCAEVGNVDEAWDKS